MTGIRNVVSTLTPNGEEVMGPEVVTWHYPDNGIMNGSLLTVESNHFCVLKSRGAILNVYDTGQYPIQTPDHPLVGSIQQAFYGGQSPWQYEAIYINRAKLVLKTSGMALSREMAEMIYSVDYYIHIETRENAVRLVQHMPYRGHTLTIDEVNAYAGPVIEQAVNQLVQVTPLEEVNERIHDLSQIVYQHLQEFLAAYGISLDTIKVLVFPRDERMKALIALKAFGLSELDAVRYYTAMLMAERGVVSAPNMAIGQPFNIAGTQPTMTMDRYVTPGVAAPTAAAPNRQVPPPTHN
ncbi:MAG TPA: SPFH domain-containing protein [Ktedonobacteraceae bacterium]|jgi:membrane protease subunit (stomatin/prohibitin family)|nr:SPFH domain-containing protein [Ktedonobacteraceae bacterium]